MKDPRKAPCPVCNRTLRWVTCPTCDHSMCSRCLREHHVCVGPPETPAQPATFGELSSCCGKPLRWDPDFEGRSCGGLALRGGNVCDTCGQAYLSRRSRPNEEWKLAAGGLSIETGIGRIRIDSHDKEVARELIARILRLPELERLAVAGERDAK